MKISSKYVVSQVRNMREKWYKPPKTYQMKNVRFKMISLNRSAMNEIERALLMNQNKDPFDVVDEFRSEMDRMACGAKTSESNFMYSVYCDVANDVLDMMLSLRR